MNALITQLCNGELDAIAFTSSPQVSWLFQVAGRINRLDELVSALNRLQVAAVGPVVGATL